MPQLMNGSGEDGDRPCLPHYGEPIAIIGMATRLPQDASTNEKLWKFLLEGRNSSTPFPSDRVNHEAHYHPDSEHAATFHSKGGHFVTGDTISFDSHFFGLTKGEVMTMDPQQRILLENVYHALENAGIPLDRAMSSDASVFVSGFNHDHLQRLNFDPQATAKYKPTGSANSILANRVSWFFDFKSASVTVDSACSSSMVALHLGCQSLRTMESTMAVVCGVNLLSWPNDYMAMSHHGFLSPDGKCYSFDHRANGYSRGEGVGTLILKRISDAIKDGDTIRAVVRGSAINQDGRTPGITLPNANAQIALMRDAYARAGLNPEDTTFVEAHGTGTAAGDPIEARAIAHAFKTSTRKIPLYVGAMKSGIGHLEGASGVASVMKAVMMLESGIVTPNANFEKVNPKIPVDSWKLHFPTQVTHWPTAGIRRVSVNSTGFGGTNAHAILEDAHSYLKSHNLPGIHRTVDARPTKPYIENLLLQFTALKPSNGTLKAGPTLQANGRSVNGEEVHSNTEIEEPSPLLFPLSAFDEDGVMRNAESLSTHLKALPLMDKDTEARYLSDLSYTLCKSRSEFAWRSCCISSTLSELVDSLGAGLPKPFRASKTRALGFIFTGQGAQWHAMGRELFIYPTFRTSIELADTYLKSLGSSWSLLEEFYRDKSNTMINEPAISQVACAALQIATVDLLSSWNIQPSRVVGHSSGEIAAAYCAGKLGRQAAWRIAYFRGIISSIKYPTKGAMLAVGASQHDLAPYMDQINHTLPGELIVACYNSPINNTVSGNEPKVDALKALLDASGIFARKLTVANAYHSSHMRAAANVYFILLGDLKSDDKIKTPGEITMFSSVTGQIVSLDDLESAQHWVDNLVSPVNFSKTLAAACFQNVKKGQKPVSINNTAENIFLHDILEVGPHGALQSAIKQTISAHTNATPIEYMSILNRNSPGLGTVLMVPATLKSRGYNVDLNGPNVTTSSYCPQLLVNLPPYVLNHTSKIWFESRLTRNFRLREHPIHDLFGAPVDDWNADEPRWRNVIRVLENPRLKEHIMTGSYIYPGVGYIVMATEAAKQLSGPNLALSGFLRDISIKAALHVPDTRDGVEVMVYMSRMDESSTERSKVWSDFKIMSWNSAENDWIEHCTGYISVETDPKANFIGNGFEVQQESIILQQKLENAVQRCQYPLDITRFYENMSDKGLVFGPLFRNLSDVKMSKGLGEATGVVTIPDVAEAMPKNFMHPHVIHPCTLDSMLHLSMMSILDSLNTDFLPVAMLPTFMREVWVSAATDTNPGHKFCGHGKSTLVASQKYETDITVWDADLNQPRVMIKGLKAAPVSNTDTADSRVSGLCHALEWKPDVTLYKSNKMPNVVQMSQDEINYRRQEVEDLQLATMLLIMDALDQLEGLIVESLEGHFQKYYNWLKLMANVLKSDDMIHLPFARWLEHKDDEKFKTRLYKKVARRSAEGELRIRAGSNIVQVLKKEVDPLHLLFGLDDLLDNVYAGSMEAGNISGLVRACMDLIAHCHTDLKILEIGAGTGSLTAVLLETLSPIPTNEHSSAKGSRIAKYDFTDVSASFFEKSKERFKAWRNILNFFPLNIENDPQEQGFTLGEYDLIVAGNVLHATKDLQKTLGNVRRLLKPDGKLIIQEGVRQDFLFVPVAFGFLEGWWLSVEDVRRWCPFVSQEEWAKALQATGFSDIEISLRDWDDAELNGISAFVASAVDTESYEDSIPRDILVLTAGSAQGIFAASLKAKLSEKYSSLNYEIAELSDLDRVELSDVHLPDRAATTGTFRPNRTGI